MRTLKYAILGLLNIEPMTGYDLGKKFSFQLANFWTAKHSQIYPELKKLVNEGLVVFNIEISGDVLEKKVYTITEAGKRDLINWLSKDEAMEPTPKNVFRLRMYFSNNLDLDTRIKLLEHQLDQHIERLNFLESQKERYKEIPSVDSADFGDFIVLDGGILRENASIQWLKNCISYCKNSKNS